VKRKEKKMNMPATPPAVARTTTETLTVGEAYLRLLADRGIKNLFANAGTDFAPLIEGYVKSVQAGVPVPKPVTVPHENVAVCMAIGHWMVSGEAQAVMVHVNVGTANTICGLLNAAQANVPMLLSAGRTPLTETGMEGGRNIHIHWTQEMFDQAGMVREAVKWDYELRNGTQLETVVDRALNIAHAAPTGPVYLTLPREVLASPMPDVASSPASRHAHPVAPHPDPQSIDHVAALLAKAERPMIITNSAGFDKGAMEALASLADRMAVPVVQYVPRCVSLPASHPMHAGYDSAPLLAEADLVIVVDCAVPWIPGKVRPRADAKVVHIGVDPLYQRIPIRGFECDLAITAGAAASLQALDKAVSAHAGAAAASITSRRARVAAARTAQQKALAQAVETAKKQAVIHPTWLTHCVNEAVGEDAILVREAPQFAPQHYTSERPGSYFSLGAAGGLGWGMGAAIGAKLAAPHRLVVAVEGDGSYMFCAPVAAHYVALEQDAPFLTVIVDNQKWNEVGSATRHLYPDGHAASNRALEPLTYFDQRLRLEKVVECVGGYGERVTDPAELPAALARAIRVVTEERRQAVLDVVCSS
jgi:acetolactate synthase-1/2/3 large subunit